MRTLTKWTAVPVLYLVSVGLLWAFFGSFSYSVPVLSLDTSAFDSSESNNILENDMETVPGSVSANISLFDAFLGPLIFLGSLLFSACAGAGLATLPFDLISRYVYRPRKLDPEEYVIAKKILRKESEAALVQARTAYDIHRELVIVAPSDKRRRKDLKKAFREKMSVARTALHEFEEILTAFQADENILESNPLTFYMFLFAGVAGSVLSALVILQTLMHIVGVQGALEYLVLRTESDSFVVAALFFLGVTFYVTLAIAYGTAPFSQALEGLLPPIALKPEGTFRESFHQVLIMTTLGQFGMMVYFVRFLPRYLRYLAFDAYFNRVLTRLLVFKHFYSFALFEWLFLGCFLVSVFVCTFQLNGAVILRQKVADRTQELQAEKEEVARLDGTPVKAALH